MLKPTMSLLTLVLFFSGPDLLFNWSFYSEQLSSLPTESDLNPQEGHNLWDAMLKEYVDDEGRVNYRAWKQDQPRLEKYLDWLTDHKPAPADPEAEQLAYWINAYNSFTVQLILQNYPLSSIRDLHGGNPWDVSWIEIGGHSYSLNEIEHEVIRKKFEEPRIHFAVNCAAKSCPPLINEAWKGDLLEEQFEKVTRRFIQNEAFNTISTSRLRLSKIFEWYRDDFGDLISFIQKYSDVAVRRGARVTFNDYDWSLNAR